MNFENDELYDDRDWIDDEAIISQLTFPFSKHEPSLDDAELQRLDALADSLEIQRLTKMTVQCQGLKLKIGKNAKRRQHQRWECGWLVVSNSCHVM